MHGKVKKQSVLKRIVQSVDKKESLPVDLTPKS
ncbi:hypothetical protein P22_3212 [Propionispora sp. 2/2-37]|nr:hypothetical protein P22_3212 [Propionispora sp. 2/2-37]